MESHEFYSIIFITFLLNFFSISDRNVCVRRINSGSVYGRMKVLSDSSVMCDYTNIPYARKPKRFELAQLKPIDEIVNKRYRSTPKKCIQGSREFVTGIEDCLYLHIYSSSVVNTTKDRYAVVVYLHGGSFNVGYPGDDLQSLESFVQKDIIIVTVNYRLGLFGFAATPDATIKPNLGLEDQRLALEWIHENIGYFNGDKEQVTLAGWSAGASAVTYHLYSKRSKGLFQKAIVISGSLLNPWSFNIRVDQCTRRLCDYLNINPCSKVKLQSIRTLDLIPYYTDELHFYYFGVLYACFVPTLDENEIVKPPFELILKKPINDVPILMGFTSLEENCDSEGDYEFSLKNYVVPFENPLCNELFSNITEALQNIHRRELSKNVQRMADLQHGIIKFAEIYTKFARSSLFLYQFASSYNTNRSCATNEKGALHGDDMRFLFSESAKAWLDEGNRKLRLKFMDLWINFIKHGNPGHIVQDIKDAVLWNPYNSSSRMILHIDRKLANKKFKLSKQYLAWDKFLNCCQFRTCSHFKLNFK